MKNWRAADSANISPEKEFPMILTASEKDPKSVWVMDSGCTFHITPNRDALFDFKEFEG